jgi:hypothetical protein
MAHFRFRRSFGNVGTRRFRGARPDLTPVGPTNSYNNAAGDFYINAAGDSYIQP